MKGTVWALAAVVTVGSTLLAMSAMAAERTAATTRGILAAAPRATPGPVGQLWYGGTLPAITVEAEAYSAVVMAPAPPPLPLAGPRRRA